MTEPTIAVSLTPRELAALLSAARTRPYLFPNELVRTTERAITLFRRSKCAGEADAPGLRIEGPDTLAAAMLTPPGLTGGQFEPNTHLLVWRAAEGSPKHVLGDYPTLGAAKDALDAVEAFLHALSQPLT